MMLDQAEIKKNGGGGGSPFMLKGVAFTYIWVNCPFDGDIYALHEGKRTFFFGKIISYFFITITGFRHSNIRAQLYRSS